MPARSLTIIPIKAPVQQSVFDLPATIVDALAAAGEQLEDGDVLAVSSKYTAISEGRVVKLTEVEISPQAAALAERYHVNPHMAELVLQEADYIFGGIHGFLLTAHHGIIQVNAGLDRSNIPAGHVVLLPKEPYRAAANIRQALQERLGVDIGVILTDSWLMPGRLGSVGVALATAGFRPVQDERGKADLFGNPMHITQRGIADAICTCAQMVMGERDEATPLVIVRNAGVELSDLDLSTADVSLDWQQDIYVESLTRGQVGG